MYLARFSYDVLPKNRHSAIDFIRREVEAARGNGINARLLVPMTRGHGNGAALQFEVELQKLDQLDQFRNRGIGSREETGNWMHAFSEVLTAPPCVEILHVGEIDLLTGPSGVAPSECGGEVRQRFPSSVWVGYLAAASTARS